MNVSVVTPFQYESRVFDGLRARGAGAGFQMFGEGLVASARVDPSLTLSGVMTISTLVPLSQMFGYGVELRARTDRLGTSRTPPLILRAAVPEPRD